MKVSLNSLCKRFNSGDRIETSKVKFTGKYPVFGGNGIRGYADIYNFDGRCAIIGRQGANCGNVKYYHGRAFMTEHAVVVETNENNDIGYLSYKMSLMNLGRYQGQSAQPGLSVKNISKLLVEVPELTVQKKVWRILSNIDKKIENNTKINNNLEELMKILYQRWFIEFEFPNDDGKPYKSSNGKFVYDNSLKKEIPEGWKVTNCYKNNLYTIIKPGIERFEFDKNYLATGNVNNSEITDGEWIKFENRESRANMQPIKNSIWFAKMKKSIKHITLTENSEWFINKYVLSTGFLGIKCNEYSLSYLHSFIYSDYFEKAKDMLAHGATQEAVNNEDIKSIKLLEPSLKILKLFDSQTIDILKQQMNIFKENQKLTELKDFLLPMLMNGQINVDDIEI